ncbi:MAG: PQQ-dependent sugar dehydrogenase, partial [SAR324 cluster bacterium]|nr:PQQ-dependent sugar dehydrogenase [SAR324 cluster bacterium]
MIGKLKWVMLAVIAVFLLGWVIQPAYALNVKVKVIADGLQSPVDLKEAPDGSGRLFIVEQTGTIRVVMPDGTMRPEAFLDLRASIVKQYVRFDERGTLGLAFHPDYKSNGKFYVHYSAPIVLEVEGLRHEIFGNHTTYVSEFKVSDNPNIADPKSERVLLKVAQPQFNHNGGSMNFGPDGYLYISLGDGGFADDWGYGHNKKTGNAQDLSNLLGKILRIDVNSKSKGK